jgi:hypothetical protein
MKMKGGGDEDEEIWIGLAIASQSQEDCKQLDWGKGR